MHEKESGQLAPHIQLLRIDGTRQPKENSASREETLILNLYLIAFLLKHEKTMEVNPDIKPEVESQKRLAVWQLV